MFFVVLAAPLIIAILAILFVVARFDGGPALFSQKRIGKDGKKFNCWKIRTMRVDSELFLEKFLEENPDAASEWALNHKLLSDPRITKLGNFFCAAPV